MKYFLIIFSLISLASLAVLAQEPDHKINSSIKQVTVFLNGAQVTREAKANVGEGLTKLIFDNLSAYIDPNSIQVSADNAVIMSVQFKINYLRNQEKTPFIQALEDSLESVNYQLEEIKGKKFVLEEERSLLLANKSIGGQNTGVQIAELEDAADFFRKRLTDISESTLKLNVQFGKLQTIAQNLNQQLAEYNNKKNAPSNEVIVTIKTERTTAVNLSMAYFVRGASWEPFYDLRVKNTQSPIQLFYKARITQNTGENWDDVKLKLSTGNPSQNGQRPELNPLYLNYYTLQVNEYDAAPTFKGARSDGTAYQINEKANSVSAADAKGQTQVIQTMANIEFDIPAQYSVAADGNPATVDIRTFELTAKYGYICVPKLDKEAFLVARIIGNTEISQLTGLANVYFEGTFVGQTRINNSTSDTLEISLGRDKRIIIERTKVKEFCVRNKVGSNIKETNVYEISIRNTRKEPIDILIEDQIPVSQNKDIEVEAKDTGGAQYNAETGKLAWFYSVPSGQTQKIRFGFEVKFPKDKTINPY